MFELGGGPANTTSLLELMELIGELHGRRRAVHFADWRPADPCALQEVLSERIASPAWRAVLSAKARADAAYPGLKATRYRLPTLDLKEVTV